MRIGVDLGGTKTETVVMDERSRLIVRERVMTPQDDYRATLETIAVLVRRLEAAVGCQNLPVGVGHPGAISPSTGLLKNSNSTCLNGRPFKQDLEAVRGTRSTSPTMRTASPCRRHGMARRRVRRTSSP